jgi:hypothetical protein
LSSKAGSAAPGEKAQRLPRLGLGLRLGQDPPARGDHGVGGEDQGVGLERRDCGGLLGRHSAGIGRGKLAARRGLVDLGGAH